ncbi:MAG: hypothetical protein KKC76_17085 [Proteobacteria bacterium]|nr:hypothetical protein [Pseudomonadota bacterium]MBU4294659.1 hypothetical protein [Pseudomonadota bacterium]MCG2748874.1 hypothetical protein [Desulfobulbaceae bacterium]
MGKKSLGLILIILITLVCCAGCGGDLQTNNTSQDKKSEAGAGKAYAAVKKIIEPGQLISRTEAESFTGEKLKEGLCDEKTAVGMKKCFYGSTNADSANFFQISIQQSLFMPQTALESGQTPKNIFDHTKKILSEGRIDLKGLGDEAFIGTIALHILKGDFYITIRLGNPNGKENKKELEAAGRKALENLDSLLI